MIKRLYPPLHLFFLIALVNILLFTLFRSIFYFWFSVADDGISTSLVNKAFYIGLKFDIQLATLINLPIIFLAWLPFLKIKLKCFAQYFWLAYLVIVNSLILSLYFIDIGHYDYLHKRIDVTIVRFIEDISISTEMVLESYPVFSILSGFIIVLAGLVWVFFLFYKQVALKKRIKTSIKFKITQIIASFIIIVIAGFGNISTYTLRWSDAFFSAHPFVSALASNPITYFYNTLKNNNSSFDLEKSQAAYPTMVSYLGISKKEKTNTNNGGKSDKNSMNYSREEKPFSPFQLDKPNIVMVFLESFAYFKTGLSGNPLKPTPYFDAIAKKGILFNQFYTPHGGTARSVFTAITGLPDIEMVKTSSRNPLIVSQKTIINSFVDYQKLYFIGGSVSWGNIRGLLGNNISDINFYEEFDYTATRVDVWGIQDLDLFAETNLVLKKLHQNTKPFFAIIQTSGNHRPYTIPEDNHGFKVIDKKLEEVEAYGFRSVADYNSFRYLDFSLGYFLKLIEQEDYAKNTIFVFFGDHGNERQAKHMRLSEEQLGLTEFHVPFLLYAPGYKGKGQVINKVAGEVDILPTIASSAGINYTNTTFGRDLFNPQFDDQRYAFTFYRGQPPNLGLISDKFYFTMKSGGKNISLFDLNSDKPTNNVMTEYPEFTQQMKKLTQDYYEAVRYVRQNNSSSK